MGMSAGSAAEVQRMAAEAVRMQARECIEKERPRLGEIFVGVGLGLRRVVHQLLGLGDALHSTGFMAAAFPLPTAISRVSRWRTTCA